MAWNWFRADWNCHLQTKMQDLHCTREYCLLMKVILAPPPFSIWLPRLLHCCCSVFGSRIHKVCSWNAAWELPEDVFRLKLCVRLRGLISEKGMVLAFPRRWRTAALCTADDSARASGGSGDSIPIAVWVFKLLCEISARILSSVPSLPLWLYAFLLIWWERLFPLREAPGEVCHWFAAGSARACRDYVAGCVRGQMAHLWLGLFCTFVSYWWASFPFSGCYE